MLRRMGGRPKWVLTASLTLICVFHSFAAELKRVTPDEAMKAVTFKTQPAYHGTAASQFKLTGSVNVDVIIAEDGTVEAVTVVKGNPVLGKLATDSIKKWRFTPFTAGGKAVKVTSEFVILFKGEA